MMSSVHAPTTNKPRIEQARAAEHVAKLGGAVMEHLGGSFGIRDLPSRYATYVDTFAPTKSWNCGRADARFDESRVGTGLYEGAAAIRQFFEGLKATVTHQAHITCNHLVEDITVTSAHGTVSSIVEAVTIAGPMRAVVYYEDEYAKVGGKWRFASRVIHPLMPFDTAAFDEAKSKAG